MTSGAVSAGSPDTAAVGTELLRAGGNVVDAAVGAMLAASAAEPLLTGLAGAGIAMLRLNGETFVFDMFSDMPGLGRGPAHPAPVMDDVDIDFGPTTQRFLVGPGSVAVPSLAIGLARLHSEHGVLPLEQVAQPAARIAAQGVTIRPGMALIINSLWPIIKRSPQLSAYLGRSGAPVEAGQVVKNPDLARTLLAYGRAGASAFSTGRFASEMLEALGEKSLLTAQDLSAYAPRKREAIRYRYRDADIWLPGPPSVAGLLVMQALRELEDHGPMSDCLGPDQVRLLAAAMARTEATRKGRLQRSLLKEGFVDGFLAAIAPEEEGEDWLSVPIPEETGGHTTHISVADQDGNLVGITTSLGESAGIVAGTSGIALNNFLGEGDVNPPKAPRPAGTRLLTMCCPTIVSIDNGPTFVVGTGGSSRIRSAILHAIVYAVDHRLPLDQLVSAPRIHFEEGTLSAEIEGRASGFSRALDHISDDVRRFDEANMFFGGLNIAGLDDGQFSVAADPRRSGAVSTT